MKIMRRGPERTGILTNDLRGAFSDVFDHFFENSFFSDDLKKPDWNPKLDFYEEGKNYTVQADIPGMEEKDLNIELEDGRLTLSGKKEDNFESKDKNYHRIERSYGSFTRSIDLPNNIDAEKISADYKKGVLTITIPKSHESEPKKINVKVS
jgi:HSP20 family protein